MCVPKTREILAILIVIISAFGGFGLGRLSVSEKGSEAVSIIYPKSDEIKGSSETASAINALPTLKKGGLVVASKNGTKYYFPWCSGVDKILEANKVWFDSEDKAKEAGYLPAGNCKGMVK